MIAACDKKSAIFVWIDGYFVKRLLRTRLAVWMAPIQVQDDEHSLRFCRNVEQIAMRENLVKRLENWQ